MEYSTKMRNKEKIILSTHTSREYLNFLRSSRYSVQTADVSMFRKAFELALFSCKNQTECDIDQLIGDSLQIAKIIVKDIGLGTQPVICGMMFRLVERGLVTTDQLNQSFGNEIATMVTEMLRISQVDTSNTRTQADNFRKLLLTLVTDVRVILVKLAERLHKVRNLELKPEIEKKQVATEIFDLYAPLAHRLGLYNIKTEMEDLALRFLNPEMYHFIETRIEETAQERTLVIQKFIAPVVEQLNNLGIQYEIKSRTKSINSIWNKMRKQQIGFEEVYDLFAVRIITESNPENEKPDCWRVFSIVTGLYQHNPDRMRDWISVPKSTGYESLHATVVMQGGQWVEVQIRSRRMDEIAEKGLAAHWKYKGQKAGANWLDQWLNKVREAIESPESNSLAIMDDILSGIDSQEIFVFTPKGDLKQFDKGATVLDFAFEVHSNVGMTCVGARVNGKSVPIRYKLNNGDKVEVITSKNQKPKSDWLDFVVSSKARNKIKQALKEEKLKEADAGKEVLQRRLKNWKIEFNDLIVNKLIKHFKLKTSVDFYSLIENGEIELSQVKTALEIPDKPDTNVPEKLNDVVLDKLIPQFSEKPEDVLVIDEKLVNLEYNLSKCCNPIFGDEIFGFVTINEGIKIHRLTCPNAPEMTSKYGYRIVKARWTMNGNNIDYQAGIKISGLDEIGILSKISDVVSKDLRVNVRSINFDTKDGIFEGMVKVFVKDISHLDVVIHKLLKVKGIISATRVDSI